MDVSSIAQVAVTAEASQLRQGLGIAAIRQAHQADQAVANVVEKAAGGSGSGGGRGQIVDITV